MNILITGGYGFIGSNLVEYFLSSMLVKITIIDNLSTSDNTSPQKIEDDRLKFINIDLSNPTNDEILILSETLKYTDLVYHMAGSVGVKYIDKDPKGTLQNSFKINNTLFPLFEKFNTKVVFASTSEVYGNTKEAKETDNLIIGSPDTLRWGYACAKLMSEFLLKSYSFPSVIVRFFNVTGKGQLHNYGMVLPTFINNIRNNNDLIVYGDGEQYRSFCDIRDCVEMLIELGFNDIHNNEIYNIGNPQNTISIKDLAQKIIDISNSKLKIKFRDYKEDFSKDFGEIFERKPCTDKINKYYTSKYSIDDIIKDLL